MTAAVVASVLVGDAGATSNARATGPCADPVVLRVTASPDIAAAIDTVATIWVTHDGPARRDCVRLSVRAASDARVEAQLAGGADEATTLWLPDSKVWAERLSADLAGAGRSSLRVHVGASVASSPIVVVVPASARPLDAAALVASTAMGRPPFELPDPLANAEGVLGLDLLNSAAGDVQRQIGLMVTLGRTAIDAPQSGFDRLAAGIPFAAGEQAVIAHNRAAGHAAATASYPADAVPALDYPVVQLNRPGDNSRLTSAAAAFGGMLSSVTAQRVFAGHGFRDAAGDPIAGVVGAGAHPVHLRPPPTQDQTAATLRMWSAATEASHTLAVIDVSGSMADPAGNGRSKIEVAAAAAAAAIGYFPDSSAFGLWSFSSAEADGQPWRELAALNPLGTHDQRRALAVAAARLPSLVGGNTALYDTALAAFEDVRNTYDPAKVNTVVLLTDGRDVYPAGLTLDRLLTKLRSLADPARPVPIITIGIGHQADIATLRQISAVTGGKTYVVSNPVEIRGVFLDAMLQRECRPSCANGS